MTRIIRVRHYVDGFNLHYGIAEPYQCKWIDLEKLLSAIISEKFPDHQTEKIIIFTAKMQGKAANKQKIYLKALQEHSPNIEIVYGEFKTRQRWGISHTDGKLHEFDITEEKGTDVNIACRVVDDGHRLAKGEEKGFDVACLVSNDGDLASALKVKQQLGQRVILITPRKEKKAKRASSNLKEYTARRDRILTIKKDMVKQCMLPPNVNGLTPPPEWC